MRSLRLFVVCLITALALPAPAQQNPIFGTWLSADPGVPGSLPASAIYISFLPNGTYETRTQFAGGAPGQAPGTSVVRGRYQMVGQTELRYWETQNILCTSTLCTPYPPQDPGFGRVKQGAVQFVNPNQMFAAGRMWWRQR